MLSFSSFPLGRPLLSIIGLATVAGLIIFFRPPTPHADLTLWVSADLHKRIYEGTANGSLSGPSLLDNFRSTAHQSVRLDLINSQALDVRLLSLFMFAQGQRPGTDNAAPDVVEVPLESIGKYFRAPVAEVGFLPINDYLQKSGWKDRIVASRFAPYSKAGIVFGIPHDLHPCTLSYRKDLFDQAGVDLESAATWPQLMESCLKFQQYWTAHHHPRTALGLNSAKTDMLMVMLRQQHINLVDANLSLHLADAKVARTLAWYARNVAGPGRIAGDLNPAAGQSAVDLSTGDICGMITPDWLVADFKTIRARPDR